VVVTGYDERFGCGYVVSTGPDASDAPPNTVVVDHGGASVRLTPELAVSLRDALANNPVAQLSWTGPQVPLTLEDAVLLGWLRHTVGGVLTVSDEPA
jgi:hypothetical protein